MMRISGNAIEPSASQSQFEDPDQMKQIELLNKIMRFIIQNKVT